MSKIHICHEIICEPEEGCVLIQIANWKKVVLWWYVMCIALECCDKSDDDLMFNI